MHVYVANELQWLRCITGKFSTRCTFTIYSSVWQFELFYGVLSGCHEIQNSCAENVLGNL